jgi:hypothetical protein
MHRPARPPRAARRPKSAHCDPSGHARAAIVPGGQDRRARARCNRSERAGQAGTRRERRGETAGWGNHVSRTGRIGWSLATHEGFMDHRAVRHESSQVQCSDSDARGLHGHVERCEISRVKSSAVIPTHEGCMVMSSGARTSLEASEAAAKRVRTCTPDCTRHQ